jgi:ubiquinone/menaquinone biosynthesis C-methylase UbiE
MPEFFLDKQGNEKLWDETASQYRHIGPDFNAMFGARLVELMAFSPGWRVLDVATGPGTILFPAARRVGEKGSAIGIDISGRMVEETKRIAAASGLHNVDCRKMDAEHLEFPDNSFDAVTCASGIFYFTNIEAGINEMFRVCRPGGLIGITVFNKTPPPLSPGAALFRELSLRYGINVKSKYQAAWAPEEVRELLAKWPFRSITTSTLAVDLVYASLEEWWEFLTYNATRANIMGMDEKTRALFKQDYFAALQPLVRPEGLPIKAGALFAIAQR